MNYTQKENATSFPLTPDIGQAKRHLELLGYGSNEAIYMREFAGKGMNALAKKYTTTLNKLPTNQHSNCGIYFVPNGQGQKKENISYGRVVFADFDDERPLEDQLNVLEESGFPKPTCIVQTRRGIHPYWSFSEEDRDIVPIEFWVELQKDVIQHLGSDPACSDASRVMRLAGYYHTQKDKEPLLCHLISEGGQRYRYWELRNVVPCRQQITAQASVDNSTLFSKSQILKTQAYQSNCNHQLSEVLHADILPRLDPEKIFSWAGHEFKWEIDKKKARGSCPWHDSKSGTSFHIEPNGKNSTWLWHCAGCNQGGGAVEYRYQLMGGLGSPRGRHFIEIVHKLAEDAGVELPPSYFSQMVTDDHNESSESPPEKTSESRKQNELMTGDQAKNSTEDLVDKQDWLALGASIKEDRNFNPFEYLPSPLKVIAIADARKLILDPLAIWQYLLPAVLSLMGQETVLDMSGWKVPNIIWTMLIQSSGTGKSRAKDIVTATLQYWEILEKERFDSDMKLFKMSNKGKDSSEMPDKPLRRKIIFNVATPQGIVRKLADQKNGVLWCRDELKGLFSSLNQFSKDGEGLEILLETWDGKPSAVDRVDEGNSYIVPESRLSVCGGIQPGMIEKTFDIEDAQGVLARFLIAIPANLPVKRVKGHAALSDKLPEIYNFIRNVEWRTITPTLEADKLFTDIVEDFGNTVSPMTAANPWLKKLAGQTARIAIAIHALECFYNQEKPHRILERDTLQRAYWMAQHYRHHFSKLAGTIATHGVSGILAQIQQKASAHPDGVSIRFLYNNIKKIRYHAKLENMRISQYTLKLCEELAAQGYGSIETKGKSKLYVPIVTVKTQV